MNFSPMKQTEVAENGDVIEIIDEPLVVTNVDAYKEELRKLPEVQNLTSEIDPNNSNTILMFGQKPSQGLSQITDQLMATTKRVNAQEASEMMVKLTKLMDKFDVQELENINTEERPTFVQKLFNKVKMTLDELFAKYEDMGREVDGIYQILTKYESQILKSQDDLKKLYEANTTFYEELEKYIVAGELVKEEIQNLLNNTNSEAVGLATYLTSSEVTALLSDFNISRFWDEGIEDKTEKAAGAFLTQIEQLGTTLVRASGTFEVVDTQQAENFNNLLADVKKTWRSKNVNAG